MAVNALAAGKTHFPNWTTISLVSPRLLAEDAAFPSLTRTVGKWELSIIGKTILDGKYQHILIGKKNGQTYWFARGSRKEMAALLQTIDPETHLHAPYSC